ncbi:hypothetical protein CPB83DRAFT_605146 [Crepidotus variabilis]|uniref:Uncharacterized protein n=1 Tax=Crepidotus variabilis TaxID=179855 RepID=A0A9P6E8P3_9AGAR|nr:hypothetical protein CPB83DRAFT_605146 [Crepidotus variabilis]
MNYYPGMSSNFDYTPSENYQQEFKFPVDSTQFYAPVAQPIWSPQNESDEYSLSSSSSSSYPSTPSTPSLGLYDDDFNLWGNPQEEMFLPTPSTSTTNAYLSPPTIYGVDIGAPYDPRFASYPSNGLTSLPTCYEPPTKNPQPLMFAFGQQVAGNTSVTSAPLVSTGYTPPFPMPSATVPPVGTAYRHSVGVSANGVYHRTPMSMAPIPLMSSMGPTRTMAASKARRSISRNKNYPMPPTNKKSSPPLAKPSTTVKTPRSKRLRTTTEAPLNVTFIKGDYLCNWQGCTARYDNPIEAEDHLTKSHKLAKNHGGKGDSYVQCELKTEHTCDGSTGGKKGWYKKGSLVRHVIAKVCVNKAQCNLCGKKYSWRKDTWGNHPCLPGF